MENMYGILILTAIIVISYRTFLIYKINGYLKTVLDGDKEIERLKSYMGAGSNKFSELFNNPKSIQDLYLQNKLILINRLTILIYGLFILGGIVFFTTIF